MNTRPLMLSALVLLSSGVSARISENFNSRKGVPIERIRMDLQRSCWSFHHFDVNLNGWNPGLEGDGAMVSSADAATFPNSGIYTPLLDVSGNLSVSFEYTFNNNFKAGLARWLKLCLATPDNYIVQVLETVTFDGVNARLKKKYSTEFKNLHPGEFRLVLQYGGGGADAQIAVDQLEISAPFRYPGGCNIAPVAIRDRVTGMANRSASGSLLRNDKDVNHEPLTAYLIKASPDGKVELSENGTFVFTPNKDFKGNYTSFTYKICDNGGANLCSENTTVLITFPEAPRSALNLSDFKGSYKFNGNVELAWKTITAGADQQFMLERSFDGVSWEKAALVKAGEADGHNNYSFTDKLSRGKALKNDLYYRLKQMNADGSSLSSRLLIVRVYNTKTLTMISVTPNPARNDISVNVQLQEFAYVSMRVLNSAGTSVIHKIADGGKGLNNFIIEGSSSLPAGSYNLEVIVNSKERMVVKLLKE